MEKLGNYILDIAAGPFGSNLKVECFVPTGFPIIDGANLKSFKVTDNISKFVTEEKARSLHRSIAQKNDVIVTISGNVGQISYIPEDSKYEEYLVSQRQFRVTFDTTRIYVPFLVYYFHTKEGQHKILSFANQTGVPALAQPLKNFRNIDVDFPDIVIQKKIANILESIDDKIENNKQINDNLEQQAQALYKSWFVDNQHPDCEEINLSEIIYFQEGPGIRNWQYVEKDGVRFINIRCIDGGDINLTSANMISKEEANGKYAHFLLKPFDIIMSCSGTLGRYAIVRKEHLPLCLNTSVIRFSPNRSDSDYSYIYGYLASEEFLNKQVEMACGSVQANFGPTHLKQIKIIAPPIDYCKKYNTIAMPIINKILENRREIQELHTLRNTLLPKLMSGELNINEIDR